MTNFVYTHRVCTLRALVIALAFFIWSAASLRAQSDALSGLVIGADEKPLAGVPVRAKPEGPNASSLSTIVTQTDNSGRYRFEAIPYGTYRISAGNEDGIGVSLRTFLAASAEGLIFLDLFGAVQGSLERIKVTPLMMGPALITIPDSSRSAFDIIVLPSTFSVSGRLEIPPGGRLPPMRAVLTRTISVSTSDAVFFQGIGEPSRALQTRTTSMYSIDVDVQPDGAFQFPQIPPGDYVLRLNPNLGVPAETVTIAEQNLNGITLGGKSAGVRVGGTTLSSDQPLYKDRFPEWVFLVARSGTEIQPTQKAQLLGNVFAPGSDTQGLRSVPAKAFVNEAGEEIEAPITPVQPGGRFEFLAVPPGEYYIRTVPEMGLPDAAVTVGDRDIDDIRVGNAARVRGEVVATNSGTRPPEVINLTSTRAKGQSVSALVDANGSFEFPKIGVGTYRILLDGKVRPTPAEIEVGDGDVVIRVETPFAAWVRGRVKVDGPSPPSDSLDRTKFALSNGYGATIKADGSFQIKSNEGEYEFFVIDLPEGYSVKSVTSGGADLLMEAVKVDLAIPTPEILVTLQYKPVAAQ